MSGEKIRAARARIQPAPDGAKGDGQIHVYIFDVFNEQFLPGKSFETVERAVQFQRQAQEEIYILQEAEPELYDLPFLSHDPALLERVEKDAAYKKSLTRELRGDARARGRRH